MIRRDFLQIAAAASPILSLLHASVRRWPFVEIDITHMPGHREAVDGPDWSEHAKLTCCDCCWETFLDDMPDGNEGRKFYRTTDGGDLIVCERCTADYLRGE